MDDATDHLKLRLKIGQNEFEAEGSSDKVEREVERFCIMVQRPSLGAGTAVTATEKSAVVAEKPPTSALPFAKVYHEDGKLVSLIGRPSGENRELDAALTILLGYKALKSIDSVSADELLHGLKQTGYNLDRSDRLMARGEEMGLVTRSGIRRGTRYRLTFPGLSRANEVGREIMDMFQIVP